MIRIHLLKKTEPYPHNRQGRHIENAHLAQLNSATFTPLNARPFNRGGPPLDSKSVSGAIKAPLFYCNLSARFPLL
jgi:hypothetical protein